MDDYISVLDNDPVIVESSSSLLEKFYKETLDDYISVLDNELLDLSIYYNESVIFESSSSLLEKVEKFYKETLQRIVAKGNDILSEITVSTAEKLDNRSDSVNSYIDKLNRDIGMLHGLKEKKISRVEVYNYRKAFEEFKKDSISVNNDVKYFISIYKDEDSDFNENVEDFQKLINEINYDIERICNKIDYISVDTAIDILEKAKTNRSDIMCQFNDLYKLITDTNKYARSVVKSDQYDEETKNKIITALSIMSRKLVVYTTKWTNYFKVHYPLGFV